LEKHGQPLEELTSSNLEDLSFHAPVSSIRASEHNGKGRVSRSTAWRIDDTVFPQMVVGAVVVRQGRFGSNIGESART
jgi:hypothetical protein